MDTWVEKYRPKSLGEVAGNPGAIKAIAKWAGEWNEGVPEKRVVLVHGPAGVGKTSIAIALAKELGYDSIELNASDVRTYPVINRLVGTASRQHTLASTAEKRIIILDEVDGIHGKSDYGGLKALKKLVKETLHPMVLIANDPWVLPRDFRSLTLMVPLKRIDQRTVLGVLKEICTKEGISTEERVLKIIAVNANGDLRSAINDLQALTEGRRKLGLGDIDVLTIRDSEIKIFDTLIRIFKTTSCDRAREAINESGEDPDLIMKWVVENLPREYVEPEDLALAYERLSKADIYKGRIMRRQAWKLLSYSIDMMSAGVATAKKHKYNRYTRYQYPQVFALYSSTKKKRAIMDSIADKIKGRKSTLNEKVHCSKKIAIKEFFPLLELVMNHDPAMGAGIASELGLELEEIKYFTEDGNANKIYEDSKRITTERLRDAWRRDRQVSLTGF
ncbi:MAG: replication factor C large subunit [Candidatus Hydrothermarchaeota archaeon]|nr:replication factor C large subunit [Candidatus Hydrothermarchaeota archaeon]